MLPISTIVFVRSTVYAIITIVMLGCYFVIWSNQDRWGEYSDFTEVMNKSALVAWILTLCVYFSYMPCERRKFYERMLRVEERILADQLIKNKDSIALSYTDYLPASYLLVRDQAFKEWKKSVALSPLLIVANGFAIFLLKFLSDAPEIANTQIANLYLFLYLVLTSTCIISDIVIYKATE